MPVDPRLVEMARYVDEGILDAGITGHDWIVETQAKVVEISELVFSKTSRRPSKLGPVRSHNPSPVKSVKDLEGKRIATEAVGLTQAFLAKHGVNAKVEFSWGATEVKPPRLADAIVEVTETGSSLKANDLRILDEVLQSTTRFIANKQAASYQPEEAEDRQHRAHAPLLPGRRGQGGHHDERAAEGSRGGALEASRAADADGLFAVGPRLGRRQHDSRRGSLVRGRSMPPLSRPAVGASWNTRSTRSSIETAASGRSEGGCPRLSGR